MNMGFKVGDKVTYTNDNGAVFEGHTITKIDENQKTNMLAKYGSIYFLDLDCYWYPVHPDNLKKEIFA